MQSPSLNLISEPQLRALMENQVAIWENFFPMEQALQLRTMAQEFAEKKLFTAAAIGTGTDRHQQREIRGDEILWLEPKTLPAPLGPQLFSRLEILKLELNQKLYLGLTHFECHLAHYAPGQGYAEHIDQSHRHHHWQGERIISFVLYLNQAWRKEDGGEFIYKDSAKHSQSLEPLFNRLVLFRSDTVPHAVAPAHKDRWSLTGWMRRS
jgi:SM-20-related protein